MKRTSMHDASALEKVTIGFELDMSWADVKHAIKQRTEE